MRATGCILRTFLALGAWRACAAASAADLELLTHDASGAVVADAVVYATPTVPMFAAAGTHAVIDQVNRRFVPRVSVLQTGTAVQFPNSDNIRHSVYSFSQPKVFTLKLYSGQPASPVIFDKPGVVVLGCNIHDKMVAWLLIIDTPFFAHTDQTGSATLKGLPAGDYVVRAWNVPMTQEQDGQAVHIGAAAPARVTLQVEAAKADVAALTP